MPFSNLRGRALTCGWQWAARARTPLGLSGEYLGRWPTQHFEPVSCRGAGLMAPPGPLPELGPKRWSQGRPVLLRCRAFGQSLPVGSWAESGGGAASLLAKSLEKEGRAACRPACRWVTGCPSAVPWPHSGAKAVWPPPQPAEEGRGGESTAFPLLLSAPRWASPSCLSFSVPLSVAVFNHVLVSSSLFPQWIPLEKAFERKVVHFPSFESLLAPLPAQ